jgi:hypothetical protein
MAVPTKNSPPNAVTCVTRTEVPWEWGADLHRGQANVISFTCCCSRTWRGWHHHVTLVTTAQARHARPPPSVGPGKNASLWRHLIQPIEKVQRHPGFDARGATDEAHTKARVSGSAVRQALD